jgi:hypothetical protein
MGTAATCSGHRYIAFSGLPADPDFNTKQVRVLDHTKEEPLFRGQYGQHILAMRITPTLIVLAFYQHIEIWNTETGVSLNHIPTSATVYTPLDISGRFNFIAMPGPDVMSVRVAAVHSLPGQVLKAADDILVLIRVSRNGQFLACANADGKIVRVFEIEGGGCIGKFKRGNTTSVIHSIDFSPDCSFLAVVSQNGTIHFFDLRNRKPANSPSTFRSIHKISINQAKVIQVMWGAAGISVMMPLDGLLLNISVDPGGCAEVGRSQISVLRKIEEESV